MVSRNQWAGLSYPSHFVNNKITNRIKSVKLALLVLQVLDQLDLAQVKNTKIGDEV